jgi:hypothetical protein
VPKILPFSRRKLLAWMAATILPLRATRAFAQPPGGISEANDRVMLRVRQDLREVLASGDDFEIVAAVRAWAYRNIDRVDSSEGLLPQDHHETSFGELVERTALDEGGLFCGGTAQVLKGIFDALGYSAHTYNFGFEGTNLTHVTTAVEISHAGKKLLSVQDGFFDFTLMMDGAPLGLHEALDLLGDRQASRIQIVEDTEGCKPTLTPHSRLTALTEEHGRYFGVSELTSVSENLSAFCSGIRLTSLWGRHHVGALYRAAAHDNGLPSDSFLYIMLRPISTSGAAIMDGIAERARVNFRKATATRA